MTVKRHTIDLAHLGMRDLDQVGGKNSSLGEMISHLSSAGVSVPGGFATTADSFREFLSQNGLDKKIYDKLTALDTDDVRQLTVVGKQIREMIIDTPFTPDFEQSVRSSYQKLAQTIGHDNFSVAVRSSATAEDLPDASFAGQQETFLNVKGEEAVLAAIKQVFASLFNDRAIAYRVHHNFAHNEVALSAGIQQMIRSDLAVSGVMFTMDTESGFDQVVFITSSYGLGEMVVQGAVNPDEFYVHKPCLEAGKPAIIRRNLGSKALKMIYCDDPTLERRVKTVDVDPAERLLFSLSKEEVEQLANQALIIEKHYGRPMDIEWAKDGVNGKLYILQARPETVKSRDNKQVLERYTMQKRGDILAEGRSIGQRIGQGKAKVIKDINEMHRVQPGDVLISDMTDPDWEPVMKRASAIVTNRGGRTCHAAIIARELGIPAVVGCGDATKTIKDGDEVTVSCAEGDTGFVYSGLLPYEQERLDVETMPELPMKVMLNVGNPERAFAFQSIPNSGVGLARLEFLISNTIGIHPKALLEFDTLKDEELKRYIKEKTVAYDSPVEYYIERLKEGIATIAAAFYPKPVIVRLSDFKSNEYANLVGGSLYEPHEENPMLGFRGASRYVSSSFSECFALECKAVRRVREEMGLDNVEVMIPFVRTVSEASNVIEVLKKHGLERGKCGLRVIMMCELPSNALLASEFLQYFDGFSIGSNDLTQLTLGLDRDSGLVASQFDERNDAVKALLHMAISACKKEGKYIGICGQGPSDHQDFAQWLMKEGIESVSLNPDSVLQTCLFLAKQSMN
ncbi:TPA: phosphoenolpyruvate synthase [Legionella pneumophila subsp. pneumophila]|uniref:Phosphoenolpyruvate synthase n=1 Tax=Legionella pneumophila (strain Lens) TaxID=297245 RepID=Q5WYA1_LEGPL|nr:phosphoenolpyruvate synthase [Legionella pneumophila]AOW52528.1 phosphoenolpyruvate synthase [Legionella pneumophila subsp. pneumophila]AOW53881.1 phosphoenolpyruvate synthase [Legionella pneumophila subsp. pneumophila]AOW57820.1 phosphoenolpyruvate synthase [Legionella pneumophila subsp. pneumophila]AOW61996.1 phosphoenolpyruvate synthase [Legionella pneumophila subsp. pneumophila]AOW63325.1 phosphoenolpyruvate synthase [Legionella pneumophila subsp. pneumophila]